MKNLIAILVIIAALLGFSSLFVVSEGQRAIVIQFGKVQRDADTGMPTVYQPGLHFKLPFIEQVKRLDARFKTLDGDPDRFITSEKKILSSTPMLNGVSQILLPITCRPMAVIRHRQKHC